MKKLFYICKFIVLAILICLAEIIKDGEIRFGLALMMVFIAPMSYNFFLKIFEEEKED